jgi:glycyl-radical enzyme activating protein/glucokinase-like ROK family protein
MIRPYAIGIDVGGTKIAAGLVNQEGKILQRHFTQDHAEQEPRVVIDVIEQVYRAILQKSGTASTDIEAVCLGFPGNVNTLTGQVLVCSNLPGWDHFPLQDVLAKRLGVPVILQNDTNLCAAAEHRYGAGRGTRNMCYVTFSTGYGVGLIINNQLYSGSTGTAGELGHVVAEVNGPPCTCGKRGCVMAYASGIGISRMAYEAIEGGKDTILRDMMPSDGKRFSGQMIAQAAADGDAVACEILRQAGYYGGIGLSMMVQIFNPELIVVGGGITRIGALIEEPMMQAMREHTQPEMWKFINIKLWELGDDLGVLGAAAEVFAQAEMQQAQFDAYASSFIMQKLEEAEPAVQQIPDPKPLTEAKREQLEQVQGVIFDIQRYSLHDGPGLRTNVFLSGCPLRCGWCSNPESQQLQPEMALFASNCMACGQFGAPCPGTWREDIQDGWTKALEEKYRTRSQLCPTGAIRWIGEQRTAGDIMQEVVRDVPFYDDGGGLTLTGGEPTMQPRLTEALLRLAKAEGISTAMETCGHTQWTVLEYVLPYLDHILFDLKHVDNDIHRAFTGVDTQRILSNLQRLVAIKAPITVRIPLIPGFNATADSLRAIAKYVSNLDSVSSVDLLPYHTLGKAKYAALGREYPWDAYERLSDDEVQACVTIFTDAGLQVNIGG